MSICNHILSLSAAALLAVVTAAPQANAQEAFTAEQEERLRAIIGEVISQYGAEIRTAVESHMRSEQLRERAALEEKAVAYAGTLGDIPETAPIGGNPDGAMVVYEFLDYSCGFCKRVHSTMTTLKEEYEDLKVVYNTIAILGPGSKVKARYVVAADMQGKHGEMHDALLTSSANLDDAGILKLSENLGLDVEKLKADANGEAVEAELARAQQAAAKAGVRGTPFFVILPDQVIPGALPIDAFREKIEEARKSLEQG